MEFDTILRYSQNKSGEILHINSAQRQATLDMFEREEKKNRFRTRQFSLRKRYGLKKKNKKKKKKKKKKKSKTERF